MEKSNIESTIGKTIHNIFFHHFKHQLKIEIPVIIKVFIFNFIPVTSVGRSCDGWQKKIKTTPNVLSKILGNTIFKSEFYNGFFVYRLVHFTIILGASILEYFL